MPTCTRLALTAVLSVVIQATLPAGALAFDLSGFLGVQARAFAYSPLDSEQRRHSVSAVAQPDLYFDWDQGQQSFTFVPFARIDSADARRSHVDVREALWQNIGDVWELRAGLGKVFWGTAESRHLVDIINQSDLVEDLDGEEKLGQPMLNLALIQDWGTVNLFVLPGFRERTFPGTGGRLRSMPKVDVGESFYTSSAGRRHVDLAARWSHAVGEWDIGLSHFWGTSREPVLVPRPIGPGSFTLVPRYDIIHQTGLDLQATIGNGLWKLEAIRRSGQGQTFMAAVGGFEYTFVGIGQSEADLGVLAEYHFDDRRDTSPQPFEDDVFAGMRLALNDAASTEVLAGFIHDVDGDATALSVEASRRLGERWRLELELRAWRGVARNDPQFSVRSDDYIQFTLLRYF